MVSMTLPSLDKLTVTLQEALAVCDCSSSSLIPWREIRWTSGWTSKLTACIKHNGYSKVVLSK